MAKFEAPSIKSKLIHQFEFLENLEYISYSMENDAGEELSSNFSTQIFLAFLKFKPS